MQLPNVVLPLSFHLARTPGFGKPITPGRLLATRRYWPRNYLGRALWRPLSADYCVIACRAMDRAATTAEAMSTLRCTASNFWGSALWRGTSIVRRGFPVSCRRPHHPRHPRHEGREIASSGTRGGYTIRASPTSETESHRDFGMVRYCLKVPSVSPVLQPDRPLNRKFYPLLELLIDDELSQ